jgi:hypothetical protein
VRLHVPGTAKLNTSTCKLEDPLASLLAALLLLLLLLLLGLSPVPAWLLPLLLLLVALEEKQRWLTPLRACGKPARLM